jgi:hypothetical protein
MRCGATRRRRGDDLPIGRGGADLLGALGVQGRRSQGGGADDDRAAGAARADGRGRRDMRLGKVGAGAGLHGGALLWECAEES